MARFYQPDLGANPDDPFARDTEGKLVRRSFWLDMSDRSLVLAMTQGLGARQGSSSSPVTISVGTVKALSLSSRS